uniref:Uncharacterized protein n=1 Tax=Geladintestivirus 5 TaxID=3233137 RepID=A0AAU8MJN4_9CAUD
MFKQLCKNLIDSLGVKTLIGNRVKSVLDFIITDNEVTNNKIKELQNETIINTDVINKLVNLNKLYTTEFIECTDTGHKAFLSKIYINADIQTVPIIRSITIKLAVGAENHDPTYIVLTDSTQNNIIAKSINYIIQTDNVNKYVTWYFDYPVIPSGQLVILFKNAKDELVWNRVHTVSGKTEGVSCVDGVYDVAHSDWCPALGINSESLIPTKS